MDVSVFSGPHPQRGLGVVAPFDFALDRELWRWVPDEISLYLTRTPYVPVEVSLDLARLVSEHQTLHEAVRALIAAEPEVIAYACTSGSFVDGAVGERTMCAAMEAAGEVPALTTSGALVEALNEVGARRIALVTPYTYSVTQSLKDFLGEAGITVSSCSYLGLTRHIWKVPYRDVVEMARQAVDRLPAEVDALFISCTNLPTYDAIPQLEAELRIPVLSANQVTMWAALRHMGTCAVGPYQTLLDASARRMLVGNEDPPVGALPEVASLQDPPGVTLTDSPGFAADPSGFPADPSGFGSDPAGFPAEPAGVPAEPAGYPAEPAGVPAEPAGYPADAAGVPVADPAGVPVAESPAGPAADASGFPVTEASEFPLAEPPTAPLAEAQGFPLAEPPGPVLPESSGLPVAEAPGLPPMGPPGGVLADPPVAPGGLPPEPPVAPEGPASPAPPE